MRPRAVAVACAGFVLAGAVLDAAALGERSLLGGRRELDEAWASAVSRLNDHDYSTAAAHLARVLAERRRFGSPSCYGLSDALLVHAKRTAEKGLAAEALDLLRVAGELSPDNPRVPLLRAEISYQLDGIDPGPQLGLLVESLKLQWGHLPERMVVQGRLAGTAQLAILWVVVLFGGLMLVRHGPRLLHDMGHLLPRAVRGFPFAVLAFVALVAVPISIGAGLVLMSLVWCVVLWPYLGQAERVVGAVLCGLTAVTPLLCEQYGAALDFPGSPEEAVFHCARGRCPPPMLARLQAASDDGSASAGELVALGLVRKRYGAAIGETVSLGQAVKLFERAAVLEPGSYAAALGLASARHALLNAECAQRGGPLEPADLAGVDAAYRAAIERSPSGGVEAEYGRAVALWQLGKVDEAAASLERARAADPARVDAWHDANAPEDLRSACPANFAANTRLMELAPDVGALAASHTARRQKGGALLVPLGTLVAGILDASFLRVVGVLCGVLLLLGVFLGRLVKPAYRCSVCGRIACGRCREELRSLDICERCLFIKIKGSFVDSRDKWLRDRGIQVGEERRLMLSRLLTFLLPGAGHLLRGFPVVGTVYLVCFVFFAILALASPALVPEPGIVGNSAVPIALAGACGGLLAYVVAVVEIHVRDR